MSSSLLWDMQDSLPIWTLPKVGVSATRYIIALYVSTGCCGKSLSGVDPLHPALKGSAQSFWLDGPGHSAGKYVSFQNCIFVFLNCWGTHFSHKVKLYIFFYIILQSSIFCLNCGQRRPPLFCPIWWHGRIIFGHIPSPLVAQIYIESTYPLWSHF